MKVLYVYRNQSLGFSIAKVFRPIENEMKNYAETENFYLPIAGAKPWNLWKNINAACQKANEKQYDIIHITGSEYYLTPFLARKHKVVVTVHDLGFYTNTPKSIHTFLLYLFWIKALKWADKITCISDKTQNEVSQLLPCKGNQICTIYNPVDAGFKYLHKDFNDSCPVVLHIGTKENKNLYNTVIALKNIHCHLRIIGKLNAKQISLLRDNGINYTNTFNLTDDEIKQEYEHCDIVNFPSLYEGFGMPIIEGQAIGRVVVTSNLSPMKEIASQSAILVDPTDPVSILQGYKEAIEHHANYIEKGLNNVRRFQVGNITRDYYLVYRELLQNDSI